MSRLSSGRGSPSIPPWWSDQPPARPQFPAATPPAQTPPPPDRRPATTHTVEPPDHPVEPPEEVPPPASAAHPQSSVGSDTGPGSGLVVRPRFPTGSDNAMPYPPPAAAPQLRLPATMAAPVLGDPPPHPSPRRRRWLAGRQESDPVPPSAHEPAVLERSLASYDPVSLTEAIGFAVRFAADYLSWDEDEPARRAAALRAYLPGEFGQLGWSGVGRQRADLVTAGRSVTLPSGVVVVEVSARVVSYRRVNTEQPPDRPVAQTPPELVFAASSAPAPDAPGWESGASWWARIAPPVRRHHDGRLVIDLALDPARAL